MTALSDGALYVMPWLSVSGFTKGLRVELERSFTLSTAVTSTLPARALIAAAPSMRMSWPLTCTTEALNTPSTAPVLSSSSGATSVRLPAPKTTRPAVAPGELSVPLSVCCATRKMEPFATTDVVARATPFWLTAYPTMVTLPRAACSCPKLVTWPNLSSAALRSATAFPSSNPSCTVVLSALSPASGVGTSTSTNKPRVISCSVLVGALRKTRLDAASNV